MAQDYYTGVTYRLRAGSPIYDDSGNAFLHTFGGETNTILVYECMLPNSLPSSDDFMGQGGNLQSASFSKIGDKAHHYQGRIIYEPVFVQEGAVIGQFSNSMDEAAAEGEITFIECTSINISYDIMGLVTVSYTVVSNKPGIKVFYSISSGPGGVSFSGFVTNASYNPVSNTNWFETHVTLMCVTGGSSYTTIKGSDSESGSSSSSTNYPAWWYSYGNKKK